MTHGRDEQELSRIQKAIGRQLKQTARIVASEEAVQRVLSDTSSSLDRGFEAVTGAIRQLAFAIEPALQQIDYQLKLQTSELKQIKEILTRPLETAQRELRGRAELAFREGWIPEAQRDLEKAAELNYQDFTVHHMLGLIALYHANDPVAAERRFADAAKYARPRSAGARATALEQLAYAQWRNGKPVDALQTAREALSLGPQSVEARYNVVRYLAHAGERAAFLDELQACVAVDSRYLIAAQRDPMLQDRSETVLQLAEHLRGKTEHRISGCIAYLECVVSAARALPFETSRLRTQIDTAKETIAEGGYLDLLPVLHDLEDACDVYPEDWADEQRMERAKIMSDARFRGNQIMTIGTTALIGVPIAVFVIAAVLEVGDGPWPVIKLGCSSGIVLMITAAAIALGFTWMKSLRDRKAERLLSAQMTQFAGCVSHRPRKYIAKKSRFAVRTVGRRAP